MKLAHSIHVSLIIFLTHHFDTINLLKSDKIHYTVKPLNSGHVQVLKSLSIIERCPLLGGNFEKTLTFRTKCFAHYL